DDWKHGITGAGVLKAQHPEFEMWSQGIHARSGVSYADCHMPHMRQGALKRYDHPVRSPLLMVHRSCPPRHIYADQEHINRVSTTQDRTHDLMQRSGAAMTDMINTIAAAKQAGATDEQLKPAYALQRKAQFRLDFIAAENSMG